MSESVEGKPVDAGTVAEIGQLADVLRFEKLKNNVLLNEVLKLEDDALNRDMAEFDAVISDEMREYWRGQLLSNRDMACKALTELARAKQVVGGDSMRRPMHNRSTSRPVAPAVLGGGGAGGAGGTPAAGAADERAAKIRNRAQEISRAERVPFSAAFRRAEQELGA